MPRQKIDYSSTHFYKIVCKDLDIRDFYIGHTTDFTTRKNRHKPVCNNPNSRNHNIPLYEFIRDHLGWDNFEMVLIETNCLNNSLEATRRERELIEELKPSLNILIPFRTESEKKEINQQWFNDNKDWIKKYKHNWHSENRDRICSEKKAKYQQNKDEIIAKHKQYYQNNIEELRNTRNRKCNCDCGVIYTYANKSRHERSNKHQEYLKTLEQEN